MNIHASHISSLINIPRTEDPYHTSRQHWNSIVNLSNSRKYIPNAFHLESSETGLFRVVINVDYLIMRHLALLGYSHRQHARRLRSRYAKFVNVIEDMFNDYLAQHVSVAILDYIEAHPEFTIEEYIAGDDVLRLEAEIVHVDRGIIYRDIYLRDR